MWAVASSKGREHDGAHPWTIDDLRAAGRNDCSDIMHHWNDYGRLSGGVCIEIGCGAGRLTSGLIDNFDQVFAIDVSPDQVEIARSVLGDNVSRVTFSIVEDPVIDVAPESCSAMISTQVFQHFSDYSGIVAYLRATYSALRPGATICFQIPVPGADNSELLSVGHRAFDSMRARVNRAIGRYRFMEYNRYPADKVISTLTEIGFVDVQVRIFRLSSTGRRRSHFFARKPSFVDR